MNKYLVLYHAPTSARELMASATPEQAQAGMEAWMTWAKRCGDAIVDLGVPLGGGTHVEAGSSAPAQGTVTGYSVLQADSLDTANGLLDGHPHLMMPGGSIDVLEGLPLPGM